MYLIRTKDHVTRACTSTPVQAARQIEDMLREGLSPRTTDGHGREVSLDDLLALIANGSGDLASVDESLS